METAQIVGIVLGLLTGGVAALLLGVIWPRAWFGRYFGFLIGALGAGAAMPLLQALGAGRLGLDPKTGIILWDPVISTFAAGAVCGLAAVATFALAFRQRWARRAVRRAPASLRGWTPPAPPQPNLASPLRAPSLGLVDRPPPRFPPPPRRPAPRRADPWLERPEESPEETPDLRPSRRPPAGVVKAAIAAAEARKSLEGRAARAGEAAQSAVRAAADGAAEAGGRAREATGRAALAARRAAGVAAEGAARSSAVAALWLWSATLTLAATTGRAARATGRGLAAAARFAARATSAAYAGLASAAARLWASIISAKRSNR